MMGGKICNALDSKMKLLVATTVYKGSFGHDL